MYDVGLRFQSLLLTLSTGLSLCSGAAQLTAVPVPSRCVLHRDRLNGASDHAAVSSYHPRLSTTQTLTRQHGLHRPRRHNDASERKLEAT
jgi:hypothetical protein